MASKENSGLNTYSMFDDEMQDEILRRDANFTFIDFLPRVIQPSGFFKKVVRENFGILVDRANAFLQRNKKWKIVTSESVKFKSKKGDKVDPYKTTYVEHGLQPTLYIRGLRLWLSERKDENEREQQIGYLNLTPSYFQVTGGFFETRELETLDMVIGRFNSMLQYNPLPGIRDFIPHKISGAGFLSLPKYECFSNVFNKARAWCAQQHDFRFCNVQTLEMKMKTGKRIKTEKMKYSEDGTRRIRGFYRVRVLRIAYTKPFGNSTKPPLLRELTYRTFIPVQLTKASEYENLSATRERISAWVKATGADLLSAETTTYQILSEIEHDVTCSGHSSDSSQRWSFIIRLYINGVYKEPSPEMLPPLPVLQEASCHIA